MKAQLASFVVFFVYYGNFFLDGFFLKLLGLEPIFCCYFLCVNLDSVFDRANFLAAVLQVFQLSLLHLCIFLEHLAHLLFDLISLLQFELFGLINAMRHLTLLWQWGL